MKTEGWSFAVALMGLGLAGCAGDGAKPDPQAIRPAIKAEPATPAVEAAPAAPQPRPPTARPAPPPKAAPSTQKSSIAAVDPDTLLGKSRDEMRALLGEPKEVRDERPATVWRFDGGDCALELFFYLDLGLREFRTLSYGVTAGGKPVSGPDAAGCVGRIKAKHNG